MGTVRGVFGNGSSMTITSPERKPDLRLDQLYNESDINWSGVDYVFVCRVCGAMVPGHRPVWQPETSTWISANELHLDFHNKLIALENFLERIA